MEWIKVTDRLPPKYTEVLVYPHPSDYVNTASYGVNKDGNAGWEYSEYQINYGIEHYSCEPTHWMPLPDAPKDL